MRPPITPWQIWASLVVLSMAVGCETPPQTPDAPAPARLDGGPVADSAPADLGPTDSGVMDSALADTGADAAPRDAASPRADEGVAVNDAEPAVDLLGEGGARGKGGVRVLKDNVEQGRLSFPIHWCPPCFCATCT